MICGGHNGFERRRTSFSTWLAFRSIVTAVIAIIVAMVLTHTALPKLTAENKDSHTTLPYGIARWAVSPDWLPYIPIPAVVLGIAALALRPLRPILALLSAAFALIAIIAVVSTLVLSMAPMYQVPKDLGLSG